MFDISYSSSFADHRFLLPVTAFTLTKKKKKNPKINPTSTKNIKNDAMLITRKKCDVFGPKFIPNTSTFLPFFD